MSEKANHDIFLAPIMYATSTLESVPLSIGFGINSFFPLAKRWDAGGAFRDSIQEISIKPVNFQPTVAYRFDSLHLAVAAGLDVTYAMVSLQKMAFASPTLELGNLGVDGTAVGYGYNLGAQWKPLPQVSFGVAYRSPVKLNIEGDANFAASTATGAVLLLLAPPEAAFPPTSCRTSFVRWRSPGNRRSSGPWNSMRSGPAEVPTTSWS